MRNAEWGVRSQERGHEVPETAGSKVCIHNETIIDETDNPKLRIPHSSLRTSPWQACTDETDNPKLRTPHSAFRTPPMTPLSSTPNTRFPERPITDAVHPWWVVKVLSRQEKALADDLRLADVEYYLPMYRKVVRRKDNGKLRKTVLPLFSGYLCVAASKEGLREVYSTNRTAGIIEVRNQARFIEEISTVYRAYDSGVDLEPLNQGINYKTGTRVMVLGGPLRGFQGVVARCNGTVKLVLSIECLGQAMVTVRSVDVKPV